MVISTIGLQDQRNMMQPDDGLTNMLDKDFLKIYLGDNVQVSADCEFFYP